MRTGPDPILTMYRNGKFLSQIANARRMTVAAVEAHLVAAGIDVAVDVMYRQRRLVGDAPHKRTDSMKPEAVCAAMRNWMLRDKTPA